MRIRYEINLNEKHEQNPHYRDQCKQKGYQRLFFYLYNLETSSHTQHTHTTRISEYMNCSYRTMQSDCFVVALLRAGIFLLTALFNFFLYKYRPSIEIPLRCLRVCSADLINGKFIHVTEYFLFSRKKHKNRNTKAHRKSIELLHVPHLQRTIYIEHTGNTHTHTIWKHKHFVFQLSAFVCVCACLYLRDYIRPFHISL